MPWEDNAGQPLMSQYNTKISPWHVISNAGEI